MRRIWAVAILTAFGGAAYGLEPIISFKAKGPHVSTAADDSAWRVRLADPRWVGRSVYSSDRAYLGDVAALNRRLPRSGRNNDPHLGRGTSTRSRRWNRCAPDRGRGSSLAPGRIQRRAAVASDHRVTPISA